ncbi:ABC transporter ATP-binding protein [Arcanobacterium haemolyticum]|nr:ABC transporter ATP-binding protein [Arcanobacterium haemolyticum]
MTHVDMHDTDEYAIVVDSVSKVFRMQSDRRDTFKERFVRGKAKSDRQEFHALDDVSFRIRKGTTFGLIGHNGSGKSTMLKILAGVYRPTDGAVMVSDKVDALLELGAGFHGELTGRENIYLNGAILGRSRKQIDDTLQWIIDFADIGEFIDQPVKVYSSGMTVRLGFAVAVAIRPKILIVDEIIAVGDEEFQRKCFDYMRELRDNGTTIALVTHSLSLAQEMCDEIVWLDHGRVRMVGPAEEAVTAYISEVNAKEAAKRAESLEEIDYGEDDQYRLNQGNGDCRMTHVEFFGADGTKTPFLTTDEPVTMRVHVKARKDLHDVELGLGISTDGGVTLAGPNSKTGGRLYSLRAGEETFIDYSMPRFMFQPGRYWLTTCFVRDGQIYDYSDRRTEIIVRAARAMTEPALITLPSGKWSKAAGVANFGENQ